jgi:signal transduction histidine kinase/ActR/RegA family two-component response regulator
MAAGDGSLFRAEAWRRPLERYSAATHLTVEVIGLDGQRLFEPISPTPVYDLIAGRGRDPQLLVACARQCLSQPAGAPPVVQRGYGLAVVGTPLTSAGKTVGSAVAGYAVAAFPDQRAVQRLALESQVPNAELWSLLRHQLPLASERVIVYGELLQTLCDALLSEQYRAQQLEATSARLAAESEAKDRFLAVLSHELRTPLNAMLGWARLLRGGSLNHGTADRALEVIERNTRLQADLIDELLDVSRIIVDKVDLDLRPLGLAAVVGAEVETLRPTAAAKGVVVEVGLDPTVSMVSADPVRIAQVVSNLLSNAVKFTPAGGRVDVRIEAEDGDVKLTVRDTGVGVAPEFLPFVFDRFRQADTSTTRKYTGLGLGLAIVRHLVQLHGGSVEATSRGVGQGAMFTVRLPAAADTRAEAAARRAPPAGHSAGFDDMPPLDGLRVLVVDDEADTRDLSRHVLEQHRVDVRVVASAAEAFEVLEHWRPDVLVSDIGMPGESGFDLIGRLRRVPPEKGGDVPALALTAYAHAEDGRRALAAGFQLHVAKPVEPVTLTRAVAQLAGRMKAA